jgi:hypothetical protein
MTFAEGVTLGIIGTTITLIGFAIAYRLASDSSKKDEEEKQKKKWRKIFPGWD